VEAAVREGINAIAVHPDGRAAVITHEEALYEVQVRRRGASGRQDGLRG
jgi:hypothetical protein